MEIMQEKFMGKMNRRERQKPSSSSVDGIWMSGQLERGLFGGLSDEAGR